MTSVARIDLERIEALAEQAGVLDATVRPSSVALDPQSVRALVHAVKAAQAVDLDHQAGMAAALGTADHLHEALRPFTEEPGQPENDDLGDALRPSESNGGEQQ